MAVTSLRYVPNNDVEVEFNKQGFIISTTAALLTPMNGNFGCRHFTRRPSKMKDQNSVVKSWKVCVDMLSHRRGTWNECAETI